MTLLLCEIIYMLFYTYLHSCSVAESCPTLQPHGLQQARLPCPTPLPGVCSYSCPLSRCCHPTISSSVTSFFFCLQSFPASGSFPMSWLFTSGGQSIGALASASVLPVNIQGWFPLGLTGLLSLLFRDVQESSPAPQFKSINSSVTAAMKLKDACSFCKPVAQSLSLVWLFPTLWT